MVEIAAVEPAQSVSSTASMDSHVADTSASVRRAATNAISAHRDRVAGDAEARFAELLLAEGLCRLCRRGEPDVAIALHDRRAAPQDFPVAADLTTLCSDCIGDVSRMLDARSTAIANSAAVDITPGKRP